MELNVGEILNKVKSTAVQVGNKAATFGKGVVSKTQTNIRIMDLNSQIDTEYKNAGKLLYAIHCGEEVDSGAIDEVLAVIDEKAAQLEELKGQLAKAKAEYTCPVCGKNVGKTAAFCSACGAKIERPEEKAEECEEAAEECCEESKECAEEVKECCEEAGEGIVEKVEECFEEAKERAEEVKEEVVEEVKDCFEEAKEIIEEVKDHFEE